MAESHRLKIWISVEKINTVIVSMNEVVAEQKKVIEEEMKEDQMVSEDRGA